MQSTSKQSVRKEDYWTVTEKKDDRAFDHPTKSCLSKTLITIRSLTLDTFVKLSQPVFDTLANPYLVDALFDDIFVKRPLCTRSSSSTVCLSHDHIITILRPSVFRLQPFVRPPYWTSQDNWPICLHPQRLIFNMITVVAVLLIADLSHVSTKCEEVSFQNVNICSLGQY